MNGPVKAVAELCYHCLSPIPKGTHITADIKGEEVPFCCNGCKGTALLLQDSGLTNFYKIRGSNQLDELSFPIQEESIVPNYEDYTRKLEDGSLEVYLTITNIHCSACVWLIEKVLTKESGITEARMNYGTGRLHLVWKEEEIELPKIIRILKSLGYEATLFVPGTQSSAAAKNSNVLLYRMLTALFSFCSIMGFSVALYAGYFQGIDSAIKNAMHYLSWVLATPAYLYSGQPFLNGAIVGLRRKQVTMDLPIFLGVSMAYFYSIYATIAGTGEVYFDSVATILFFILMGKYMEAKVREKAMEKVEQLSFLPNEIYAVLRNENRIQISVSEIQPGDHLILPQGSRLPVDANLLSDQAHFDESFLTGESTPVKKKQGELVAAGSICLTPGAAFYCRSDSKNSTLERLKSLVEKSVESKPELQNWTDKVGQYFVSLILAVAALTFFYWWWNAPIQTAILNTISVFIIACPCALGLSVPAAIIMGNLMNSRNGVLLKDPKKAALLYKVDSILLDKTGTVTEGKPRIREEELDDLDETRALVLFAEQHSTHPIARSLVRYLYRMVDPESIQSFQLLQVTEVSGNGIDAKIQDETGKVKRVKIGRREFVSESSFEISERESGILVWISVDGMEKGYFLLSDEIRLEAAEDIAALAQTHEIQLLSGDSEKNVSRVAREVRVRTYYSRLFPEDKLKVIESLQHSGKVVAMVGDGLNDAASIGKANVGISMGNASDLTLTHADVVLTQNKLSGIQKAIRIAKTTRRVILENISLSLLYNAIAIPVAAMGFLLPVTCAIFMTFSSLCVVANSISIRWRV